MASEVLLIIPTHNHPTTLPLAIKSAQEQSSENITIAVLGDGVNDDTRDAVSPFLSEDKRIKFIDNPKGERHGENYRHDLILATEDPFIAYLGDDDLLFKNHIELLRNLIEDVDFVNTLPVGINSNGDIFIAPADLADQRCFNWHLVEDKIQNTVSLTGVMHTRDSYLRLEKGWHPAPKGIYTDLHMWRHYFRLAGFKAKTSMYATTAKFPADLRLHMSPSERATELKGFWDSMHSIGFQDQWNERVHNQLFKVAAQHFMDSSDRLNVIENLSAELESSKLEFENQVKILRHEIQEKSQEISKLRNSKSWKITRPLRLPSILKSKIKARSQKTRS